MRPIILIMSLGIFLIAACSTPAPAQTEAPVLASEPDSALTETSVPVVPSDTAPAPTDEPSTSKLPAPSFAAETYLNEAAGFVLDYPSGWTVTEQIVGPRGTQVQFLSSPDLAEADTLPQGATRVNATIYQWDPKNDLESYAAARKAAWDASGFEVVEEESLILELGLPAVQFTVQTPDAQAIFLFAALGDQYLELSGEGDLELVREIVGRVRPISLK